MIAHQINHQIKPQEVRLINKNNENVGLISTCQAINMAKEDGLELVLVSDNPPVCKIMDYKKFVFDQKKKEKNNFCKKEVIKEYKFGINISSHDEAIKTNKIINSINEGYNVKASISLKPREHRCKQLAIDLIRRVYEKVKNEEALDLKISENYIYVMIQANKKQCSHTSLQEKK